MYANFPIVLQTKTKLTDAFRKAINFECVRQFSCLYMQYIDIYYKIRCILTLPKTQC